MKWLVVIWALLYGSALGVEPRAVITGPKESRPGMMVVLDATESQGLGRLWLLARSPEEISFLAVENGLKCIFASPVPGEYEFVLVVSGVNANGGPAAAMARHTVLLKDPRPPPPDPPPGPVPTPGPREVIILRESAVVAPQLSNLILSLQTDSELKEKGHRVTVLDPDQASPDGQVQQLIQQLQGLRPPPSLYVVGSFDGERRILYSGPVPASVGEVRGVLEGVGG